jgi:hypothetical protein
MNLPTSDIAFDHGPRQYDGRRCPTAGRNGLARHDASGKGLLKSNPWSANSDNGVTSVGPLLLNINSSTGLGLNGDYSPQIQLQVGHGSMDNGGNCIDNLEKEGSPPGSKNRPPGSPVRLRRTSAIWSNLNRTALPAGARNIC